MGISRAPFQPVFLKILKLVSECKKMLLIKNHAYEQGKVYCLRLRQIPPQEGYLCLHCMVVGCGIALSLFGFHPHRLYYKLSKPTKLPSSQLVRNHLLKKQQNSSAATHFLYNALRSVSDNLIKQTNICVISS